MHYVLVHIRVFPESIDDFRRACVENASNSIKEEGIFRFEVIQQVDHPDCFDLVEVYRTPDDQLKHRQTPHYLKWREAVAEMMAEPRQGVVYSNIFPPDEDWKK
jgi:(4S)-4-hydroxy-5-phosphonooxypentane-2,3-dione isomerase